jgi:diguanylate cyclase (GGDEF)-like protein/PAS domain S-box-containing protein
VLDPSLARDVLDALAASIAVLDDNGVIVEVNDRWRRFAAANGGDAGAYVGWSYVDACERAARSGDATAAAVAAAIRRLLHGEGESFEVDYPCHSPGERRWFAARASVLSRQGARHVVLTHEDISPARLAAAAHEASEHTLRQVLDTLPIGVWILDPSGRIVRGNPAAVRIWGGARYVDPAHFGEYKGWWLRTGEPIAAEEWAAARAIERGETSIDEEVEIECFDGTRKVILNSAIPLRDGDGAIAGAIIVNHDVTTAKKNESALRESEAKWRTLFEILPVGVSILDRHGEIVEHNAALGRILRLDTAALGAGAHRRRRYLGADGRRLAPDQFPSSRAAREQTAVHDEIAVVCEDGDTVWTAVDAAPLSPPATDAVVVVVSDVTPRVAARDELLRAKQALESANGELRQALAGAQEVARTDFLTGVWSRRHFYAVASQILAVAERYQRPASVIVIDADFFKEINDRFGHAVGDEVLKRIARAARGALRDADVLARHGGEEFAALLPHTTGPEALVVAEHLRRVIAAERVETERGPATVTVSAGVAETLAAGDTPDRLVARADRALYAAKRAGRDRAVLATGS